MACGGSAGDPPEDLVGRWELVSLDTNGAIPDSSAAGAWIEFEPDGQAFGNGVCNDYGANYRYSNGHLTFDEVFVGGSECIGATGGFQDTIVAVSGSEIRVGIDEQGNMVWAAPGANLVFSLVD